MRDNSIRTSLKRVHFRESVCERKSRSVLFIENESVCLFVCLPVRDFRLINLTQGKCLLAFEVIPVYLCQYLNSTGLNQSSVFPSLSLFIFLSISSYIYVCKYIYIYIYIFIIQY